MAYLLILAVKLVLLFHKGFSLVIADEVITSHVLISLLELPLLVITDPRFLKVFTLSIVCPSILILPEVRFTLRLVKDYNICYLWSFLKSH